LTVQSSPPGALVYLNGEPDFGRTPVSRDFTWYGVYDVTIRKEGYETVKASATLIAPWYEWVPIDLVAEVLPIPLKDRRTLVYHLKPLPAATMDSAGLMERAEEMKGQLEGPHYVHPTTKRGAATEPGK
jgi:hypothetical protein